MSIEVRGLSKRFGSFEALKDVSLDVPAGGLVALLGPSGSGKTTLLRIVAGLEQADQGEVHFHGENAAGKDVRDRRVGFVFQHYALFRHMTVFENIAFGLRVLPRRERPPQSEIRRRVEELLALVQLDFLASRYPAQLSGGQRQRVALARALAVKPEVLLLDEPFGALDAKVRKELRRWLRRLHQEVHVTTVFVTHDQEEAMEVADLIVVMNEGRIEQVGHPEAVYEDPATPFVYAFLGSVNLFHARPEAMGYVRPYDVELARQPGSPRSVEATVRHVRRLGPLVRLELDRVEGGQVIEAEVPRDRFDQLALAVGERVHVQPSRVRHFPA
jgi:sulfate/thiosulfate transport system ATP-binding protein